MPAFWGDRIGFRLQMAQGSRSDVTTRGILPLAWPEEDYEKTLDRWAHPTPGVPDFPPVSWDSALGELPFAQRILSDFRGLLERFGLTEFERTFDLDPDQPWLEFFRESVFFPAPPAFNGASFLSKFTPDHIQRLLNEAGPRGPLEFSVALSAIHERLHTLQCGDSLFCEFIVAVVWSALLSELKMWHWQIDPRTGQSSHREYFYLINLKLDEEAIGACVRDAASGVEKFVDDPGWYGAFCAAAWLFDIGDWKYDDYLRFVSGALANPSSEAPKRLPRGQPQEAPSAGTPRGLSRGSRRFRPHLSDSARRRVSHLMLATGTRQHWGWRSGPVLAAFARHSAPVAVIGGAAVSYYSGNLTSPKDLDLVYASGSDAARSLYCAVIEMVDAFPLYNPPEVISEAIFEQGHPFVLETRDVRVELLGKRVGALRDVIIEHRRWVLLDRTWTPICRLDDLVALKIRDQRAKDLEHLRLLARKKEAA